jgi:hypothetical protein
LRCDAEIEDIQISDLETYEYEAGMHWDTYTDIGICIHCPDCKYRIAISCPVGIRDKIIEEENEKQRMARGLANHYGGFG